MSLDKLKTEDLLALAEYAANSVVPDGVKITIKAGLGLPTVISDAEEALVSRLRFRRLFGAYKPLSGIYRLDTLYLFLAL